MRLLNQLKALLVAASLAQTSTASPSAKPVAAQSLEKRGETTAPKIVIVTAFAPEAEAWWGIPEFNLLAQNISFPGLSPEYPAIHCTEDAEICQVVLGEAEINAASTMAALIYNSGFDFTSTYFLMGGIAGVNPNYGTTGSVAISAYIIQWGLSYEFDARDKNASWSTGFIPFGSKSPNEYPSIVYGTEAYELNKNLQAKAIEWAQTATLTDSDVAIAYRTNFTKSSYTAAAGVPSIIKCDTTCSDTWFTGTYLSEAVYNYSKLITNGTAEYCMTAEEDSATAEVLLRAAKAGLVDFGRFILMRSASDFDRPYPGQSAYDNLYSDQGGFLPAVKNLYLAGVKIIDGLLGEWDEVYAEGLNATNYIGNIIGTLGGKRDYGPSAYDNNSLTKRKMKKRTALPRY